LDLYTRGRGGFDLSNPMYKFSETENFEEDLDGKVYNEYNGTMALTIKFEMPNVTLYRLYIVSNINFSAPIISYMYDSNYKEELKRILELKEIKPDEEYIKNIITRKANLKNEEEYNAYVFNREDVISILDCDGYMVSSCNYN